MRYKYDIYRLFFGISAVPVWYKYGISAVFAPLSCMR